MAVRRKSAVDIRTGVAFLGALGAIAGIPGAYFLLFPHGRIEVLRAFSWWKCRR